ncbi:hypothetical protein [Lacinutrix sp. Hel_I_90]|uniref:hypothetical protein n=1 Tax=Lacinutrix sp. Hel_I_90 TaxID=1249999 RepID=UPI000A4476C6|nr:hypothetical protein [Lacinutrix sp. Hel_I_90]
MESLTVLNTSTIIIISILLFFLCISILLYVKQYKIEAESKRLLKESERLSKLAIEKEKEEESGEKQPYEDFTSGHIY